MAVPRSKHILLCLKARPWSPRIGCYERDVAIARHLVWTKMMHAHKAVFVARVC